MPHIGFACSKFFVSIMYFASKFLNAILSLTVEGVSLDGQILKFRTINWKLVWTYLRLVLLDAFELYKFVLLDLILMFFCRFSF